MTFCNEFDRRPAAWLRNLMAHAMITEGPVSERSITDIDPADLDGYTRCHFFAGIGGWDLALQLAGWPTNVPVWTGSCPCQPFSNAGKREGQADPRHLWPAWFRLIRKRRPQYIFGEQVASAIGYGWLDGAFENMEAEGYTCGAAVLGAHSVGAPHRRQRLYWVAYTDGQHPRLGGDAGSEARSRRALGHDDHGCASWLGDAACHEQRRDSVSGTHGARESAGGPSGPGGLGNPERDAGISGRATDQPGCGDAPDCSGAPSQSGRSSVSGGLGHSDIARPQGRLERGGRAGECTARASGAWDNFDIIPCRDGKARRIESGSAPLAHGIPRDLGGVRGVLERMGYGPKEVKRMLRRPRSLLALAGRYRVGALRGYGNAIVPELAAEFVKAFMDCRALGRFVERSGT